MNDLFIIGAGASVPYGFPAGEELFEKIRKLDFSTEDKRKAAYKKYYNKDFAALEENDRILGLMEGLVSELERSMMVSIDDFIRNRVFWGSDFDIQADLIKRIIARIIFECEKNAKENYNKDWLHYLCSIVDRSDNKTNQKAKNYFLFSKFITFNYDRLLEYSIYKYFDCDKGIENGKIAEMLNKMHIIHANGYLGALNFACFGSEVIRDTNIKSMKTAWDKDADTVKIGKSIKEHIEFSDRIFFLGFGYLEENMKKLGLVGKSNILAGKKIYGTAYKKTDNEIKHIIHTLQSCGAKNIEINKERNAKDLILDFFDMQS